MYASISVNHSLSIDILLMVFIIINLFGRRKFRTSSSTQARITISLVTNSAISRVSLADMMYGRSKRKRKDFLHTNCIGLVILFVMLLNLDCAPHEPYPDGLTVCCLVGHVLIAFGEYKSPRPVCTRAFFFTALRSLYVWIVSLPLVIQFNSHHHGLFIRTTVLIQNSPSKNYPFIHTSEASPCSSTSTLLPTSRTPLPLPLPSPSPCAPQNNSPP